MGMGGALRAGGQISRNGFGIRLGAIGAQFLSGRSPSLPLPKTGTLVDVVKTTNENSRELIRNSRELRGLTRELKGNITNTSNSNEKEVVAAVHQYLCDKFGALPSPLFGVKDYSADWKPLYELDGLIYLGGSNVAIVKAKSHVTMQAVHQIQAATSAFLLSRGECTGVWLFIGGPSIDEEAKLLALRNGISVAEVSGSRYHILVSTEGPKQASL